MALKTSKVANLSQEMIATQTEIREFAKRSERLVKIPLASISIRKGFNLREDFGDIDSLATSIAEEGLREPLTVDIIKDGEAILTDGERRYRALSSLIKQKQFAEQFEYVEVFINDKKMNEPDRIIAMMVHNSGKPFEPLEEAEGLRRLKDQYELTITDIAKRIGKTVPYVEQRLLLASADPEEKKNVKEKKISATAQVELMRKEKDSTKRKATVKEAVSKGKKVKVKDVKTVPLGKMCDQGLELVKLADKKNKDKEIQNILFELDAKLREIKKAAKA